MEPTTRVAKVLNKPNDAPVVRHGTVESVDGDTLQVLIDNTASPITCARACVCVQGDRVVVVGKDAIATVGANYGGGGSGNIATTPYLLKGDNAGNAIAATPGTDYIATMPNRALSPSDGGNASKANAILYGTVDGTSTSTVFTATIAGLTALTDGTCMMLHNGVVTSATGFTVDVNGLGAKKCYNNMTNATQDTTIFNVNYTMLFVYTEATTPITTPSATNCAPTPRLCQPSRGRAITAYCSQRPTMPTGYPPTRVTTTRPHRSRRSTRTPSTRSGASST